MFEFNKQAIIEIHEAIQDYKSVIDLHNDSMSNGQEIGYGEASWLYEGGDPDISGDVEVSPARPGDDELKWFDSRIMSLLKKYETDVASFWALLSGETDPEALSDEITVLRSSLQTAKTVDDLDLPFLEIFLHEDSILETIREVEANQLAMSGIR